MPKHFYDGEVHECFVAPQDRHGFIWRYMDLAKFVSILDQQALFFARADKLGDAFEGSITKASREASDEFFRAHGATERALNNMRGVVALTVKTTAISCWHANEHESAAMWRLYLSSGEGIAIRSTFDRLVSSFPLWDRKTGGSDVRLIKAGIVNYVDYDSAVIPTGNLFWPFVHKRISFQHEREIRAVMNDGEGIFAGRAHDYVSFPNGGENVPVVLDKLVESVFVAPTATGWFEEIVRSLVGRYGFTFPVSKSRLGENPIY